MNDVGKDGCGIFVEQDQVTSRSRPSRSFMFDLEGKLPDYSRPPVYSICINLTPSCTPGNKDKSVLHFVDGIKFLFCCAFYTVKFFAVCTKRNKIQ